MILMHSWFAALVSGPYRNVLPFLLSVGTLFVWLGGIGMIVFNSRRALVLAAMPAIEASHDDMPTLSIVVPACNEEDTIERGMNSLLALDYPHLEIIAVNDRSTDRTGAILDRLALSDPRLRVLHVETLPAGWLGKNHAMHSGSQAAKGKWLLFTDADVVFAPDALRRTVAFAERECLDHLVLSPRCETHGFWERAKLRWQLMPVPP